jgi:hypothetical protein
MLTALCTLNPRFLISVRALRRLLLALMVVGGTSPVVLASAAAEPGPQWITPWDGASVTYLDFVHHEAVDLVFEVRPVNGSVGYLYGFFENGQMVWENWANERHLDGTRYVLARGSAGHLALGSGANRQIAWPLQIWVRGYILEGGQYHWTDASIINVTLYGGYDCIWGPNGSCSYQATNPTTGRAATRDEIYNRLLDMGVDVLCAKQIAATYGRLGPAGVVTHLPTITTSKACMNMTQEKMMQVMELSACLPRDGAEVCLTPQ